MTAESAPKPGAARLERSYAAPPELIWELWTTPAGLDQWFAPDGFTSRVTELELRPGGRLRYTMTATSPEQIAFMLDTGNPLALEVSKTFTEVESPVRLGYTSLIDFVPGCEPYEHLTTVEILPASGSESGMGGATVIVTLDPMHDEAWTRQHRAHRGEELDHLEGVTSRRLSR